MDREKSGTDTAGWYIGVSIHGIIQLLSGHPAAFFAVMEHKSASRVWPFRWAHLLTHQLEKCRDSLSLGYLVEILQQLLDKSKKRSLIQIDIAGTQDNILASLQVLIAIFKCFEISGQGDVAKAIKEVHACDQKEEHAAQLQQQKEEKEFAQLQQQKKIKEFEENVTDLTKSFPELLVNVGTDNEEMAKTCSECYNVMLNFKYEGIVQGVLHSGNSLASLGQLRKMYKCPEILGNIIDILLKCRLIMRTKHAEEYEKRQKEYEVQLQQQTEEFLQQQTTELQQQKEEREALQQQKEECEAQLQRQREELEGRLQRQATTEQQLKTKNAKLTLDVQTLQVGNQKLQQSVEGLEKEKGDVVAASELHCREATTLRGALEQLKEEKQELERKVQQQQQHKQRLENELQETRQKTHQQSATAKDEIEKLRNRVAEYERQTNQLSEELEQSKAENEKLHRQLGEKIN